MPTIIPKYRCRLCNEIKNTKETFDRHMIGCKYRHMDVKQRDMQETTLPSQQVMFQMILDLTVKYGNLEKKLERLQNNQAMKTRKSIMQYLNSLEPMEITFTKWIETSIITKYHLKMFFDQDIVAALNQCIVDITSNTKIELLPVRNYLQKPNQVYIYDKVQENIFEWKAMDIDDWKKFCKMLTKKIKILYFEWKKENREEIENNEEMAELNYKYIVKLNQIDDFPMKSIKETMIKQIQTSLITIVE